MEKTIGAFEVRRTFGKILQDVVVKGDKFIVERHGEPVAVVVPMAVYEQWKQGREELFEKLRQAQTRADLDPDEADRLAREAVKASRQS